MGKVKIITSHEVAFGRESGLGESAAASGSAGESRGDPGGRSGGLGGGAGLGSAGSAPVRSDGASAR